MYVIILQHIDFVLHFQIVQVYFYHYLCLDY